MEGENDKKGESILSPGSLVAQGCHAAVAVIAEHRDDPDVLAYTAPGPALDGMHKAVLEVKGEAQLLNLSKKLDAAGVVYHDFDILFGPFLAHFSASTPTPRAV